MNELETRLRDGLHGDVAPPDVDGFLIDVRRGAAWRRGRRASAGVALLVAGLVGGSALLQQGHDHRTAPEPVKSPSSTCAGDCQVPAVGRVVDVYASGSNVFELTVHDGCTHCSTVLRRTPAGGWQRLGTMTGGSSAFGPVQQLLMAPDGRNGWAWQGSLWSTHDGGRTWQQITDGPGRRTIRGRQVALGPDTAWLVSTSPAGRQELWRTPLGKDTWHRVRTPQRGDLIGVASNGWVLLHETGEGASGSVVALQGPQEWTHYDQPFTSDYTFRMGGDTVFAPHDGAVSRLSPVPLADGTWPDRWQRVLRLPRQVGGGVYPLDAEHLLVQANRGWIVAEPGGTVLTDLPRRAAVYHVSSQADGTSWLVTIGGRVYSSTDAVHWTLQP
jgi:hypothetical protein